MALKNGTTEPNTAFLIRCRICQTQFAICRSCYKGHRYCSSGCRDHGYKENLKRANKKYASSVEAKKDHCDRNRVYRQRLKNKQVTSKKSMMDKSSDQSREEVKNLPAKDSCHICGCKFPFAKEIAIENMELQFFHSD